MYTVKLDRFKPTYGWGSYSAAIRRKDYDRFLWLMENNCPFDVQTWDLILSNIKTNTLTNTSFDTEQKALYMLLNKKHLLNSTALAYIIKHDRFDLMEIFLENKCPINYAVIEAAMYKNNIVLLDRLYNLGQDQSITILTDKIWDYTSAKCNISTLEWLLSKNCPKSDAAICTSIKLNADQEHLNWLKDNGFPFHQSCYSAIINRKCTESDADNLCEWLFTNNCPLDPDIDSMINQKGAYNIYIRVSNFTKNKLTNEDTIQDNIDDTTESISSNDSTDLTDSVDID
jgi:hypothetical protein